MEKEILRELEIEIDDTDQLWNKFIPIADALKMVFSYRKTSDENIKITISR